MNDIKKTYHNYCLHISRKKALITIIILTILSGMLLANQTDDFRFAVGLYSDSNYSLAMSELESFIAKYPDSPLIENAHFLLANIYMHLNNYQKALPLFDKLNRTGNDPLVRPEILLGLAKCHFFIEDHNNAHRLFTRFSRDYKQHRFIWQSYYYLGRIEFIRENYTLSLNFLDLALKQSTDWTVKVARLKTLLSLSKFEEAEASIKPHLEDKTDSEHLNQMLVIYLKQRLKLRNYETVTTFGYNYIPSTSIYYDEYLLVVGEAYMEQGKYNEALSHLSKMKTKNERAEYITALSYMRTGDETSAENLFSQLSATADNIEIRTNSYFFLANLKKDLNETNRMLQQFIRENPQHPFKGAAEYQLGFNHFSQDNFGDAITQLSQAVSSGIDKELKEKAQYLIAESYFQLQHLQQAITYFNSYLDSYPNGVYVDEALFKSGLSFFRQKDYPNALVRFDRLIREYPNSERIAMANFYQGEIFTASNQYDIAFGKYQSSLANFENKGLIWLRIAQINFHLRKYDETISNLKNVPDSKDFLFEKQTILGNSYYAKREYLNALKAFEKAEQNAVGNASLEDAVVRQARALYQLNEYREALRLYRRLLVLNPQEQYLLSAAAVSFTANDYRSAISFYQEFIEKYPQSRDINRAKLHLADSYYNLKEYERAASNYQKLIRPEMESATLNNSLNGLEWSALQSDNVDFELQIKNSLPPDSPLDFRLLLNSRLTKFYYDEQRWNDVIETARYITEVSPVGYNNRDIRLLKAKSLTNLQLFDQAEQTYRSLNQESPDANVLYHWAEMYLVRQNSSAALNKLREAIKLTRESAVWLETLKLGVKLGDEAFLTDYEKYLSFARNVEREQAQLLWIEWQIEADNYTEAEGINEKLLQSEYEPIKARAQFFKGVLLYRQGKITEAIRELLRVRYLYPRIEDVRIEAELLACYAYLDINDKENALKLYDAIKNNLPQEQRIKLQKELGLEG